MKKILSALLVLLVLFTTNTVNATPFSGFIPGGKNYLDPNNFEINMYDLYSLDLIRVKPETNYVLSLPGRQILEGAHVLVESDGATYLDEDVTNSNNCVFQSGQTYCIFRTIPDEVGIMIQFQGPEIERYYDYYGMETFQLEEGTEPTDYEEYVQPLIDTNSPEFSGSGAFIKSYYDSYTIQDIIDLSIVVVDDIDGDLTNAIEIVSDAYTGNENTVGEYLVELKATDNALNTATFHLTIIVKDEDIPSIIGPDQLLVNISDNKTITQIINENYIATDGHDGSLVIATDVDNYTSNAQQLGAYNVSLSATDSSLNKTTKDIIITIQDSTAPTLNSTNVLTMNLSNPNSINDIINSLDISDNYDARNDLTIEILTDNFSSNSGVLGTYEVNIGITDLSNNQSSETLFISVVDDVLPNIIGPANYSFSYTEEKSIDDLISLFTVSDNYDPIDNSNLIITNNTYSSRGNQVGTFYIDFEVNDNSGNKATHHLEITIIDDQAPIIYIDNYLITVTNNASFQKEDALRMLINNRELPDGNYDIEVVKNEYQGNEEVPGSYLYSLKISDQEGISYQKDFVIRVPEEESETFDSSYLVRNIITYTVAFTFIGFVAIKTKK